MKKQIVKAVVLATLALPLFQACEHAEFLIPGDENTIQAPEDPEVTAARAWYDLHKYQVVEVRSGETHPLFNAMEPYWIESYTREDDRCKTVEIALMTLQAKRYILPENNRKYKATGDLRYLQSMTRLVIRTNMDNARTDGFFMQVIPSVQYLEATDFKPFYNNTYLTRDEKLDGYVLFYQLDGKLINGWKYENGQITSAVREEDPNLPGTRGYRTVCYDIYEDTQTDYYYYTEFSDPVHSHTTHQLKVIGQRCQQEYFSDGGSSSGGSSSGGGNNPGSSGGNSGGTPFPYPTINIDNSMYDCPKVQKIYEELNSGANTYLSLLTSRYMGKDSEFSLTYIVVDKVINPNNGKALHGSCEIKAQTKEVLIRLSKDYIDKAKPIEIAKTILHESVHAYIQSYIYTRDRSFQSSSLDEAWSKYEKDYKPNENGRHEFMATEHIGLMATELERIHKNHEYTRVWAEFPDYTNGQRRYFYEGLAWRGLKETSLYRSIPDVDYMENITSDVLGKCSFSW